MAFMDPYTLGYFFGIAILQNHPAIRGYLQRKRLQRLIERARNAREFFPHRIGHNAKTRLKARSLRISQLQ